MQIVARRIDGPGRLWVAQRAMGTLAPEASEPSSWSLHASRPEVDVLVAEALRDGKRVGAYDEPVCEDLDGIPRRFAAALDRVMGSASWHWQVQPTARARVLREQEAIAWFLSDPTMVVVMGEVIFEKRLRPTMPSSRARSLGPSIAS